jgi:hypothetical protein
LGRAKVSGGVGPVWFFVFLFQNFE